MTFIQGIIEIVLFTQCKTVSSNLCQFQLNVTGILVAHLVTNALETIMYVTITMTASMEVMRLIAPLFNVILMNICANRVMNAITCRGNATKR